MSSIEDIDYLKNNSIKQSFTFLIDSKDRDRNSFPDPNNYTITFSEPFRNVIGIEIVDASIPRTMYSVDIYNNSLYYYIGSNNTDELVLNGFNSNIKYDINLFSLLNIPVGDYSLQTFLPTFNNIDIGIQIVSVSNPPELTNLITFTCKNPFILNMYDSKISETLGFDTLIKENNDNRYKFFSSYNNDNILMKMYHSLYDSDNEWYYITSPGMVYFMGDKYIILRCPDIEDHSFNSLSYAKHNLGIAKFRINGLGFNDEKLEITKVPIREFHPIGKFTKMTLKFQNPDGLLYDFKGVNHNIVFAIYYYEPRIKDISLFNSILNPNYKPDYNDYLYTVEEQENDDDENEDEFSRDNINIYKKKEILYSNDD